MQTNQTQKLVVTAQVQQSLKILQYSSQELQRFIQQELEENPLLDLKDENTVDDGSIHICRAPVDWKEFFEKTAYYDSDVDNAVYQDEEEDYSYENMVSRQLTLREHLHYQLEEQDLPSTDKKIGVFIIECMDDNGYLPISKHEIAQLLGIDRDTVSRLLGLIQTFDPPGVGARSLRECLLIQLKRRGKLTATTKTVVLEHLKDIADNRLKYISRRLGISLQRVRNIVSLVKSLEPKPGRVFAGSCSVGYIIPDVTVDRDEGGYRVLVREYAAPSLRINNVYREIMNDPHSESGIVMYITERLESALQLIKAIEQRKNTLKRVTEAIISHQRDFFDNGIFYLKPLTLQAISQETGLHESTVSRAVNGKYVQTPRGVFELSYFFDSGVMDSKGRGIASQSIRKMIAGFIANEDKSKPISDQHIALLLKERGIQISRRTVAKYREEDGIPNSIKRKKYDLTP